MPLYTDDCSKLFSVFFVLVMIEATEISCPVLQFTVILKPTVLASLPRSFRKGFLKTPFSNITRASYFLTLYQYLKERSLDSADLLPMIESTVVYRS